MEFTNRTKLAETADSCPECGSDIKPRDVFQLGDGAEVVEVDITFFHTTCPSCDVMWDEYYGWK
jgi:hypothetical protein